MFHFQKHNSVTFPDFPTSGNPVIRQHYSVATWHKGNMWLYVQQVILNIKKKMVKMQLDTLYMNALHGRWATDFNWTRRVYINLLIIS